MSVAKLIRAALEAGAVADLGGGSIEASDLRDMLVGASRFDPRGLQLLRGRVEEELDLRNAEIQFPLRFIDCEFDAVCADGAHVEGDLVFAKTGTYAASIKVGVAAGISLVGAHVQGRLILRGVSLGPCNGFAVQAWGAQLDGGVGSRIEPLRLDRPPAMAIANESISVSGTLAFSQARIGRSFELVAANITALGGLPSIDFTRALIDGPLELVGGRFEGRIDVIRAQVGSVALRGIHVDSHPEDAGPGWRQRAVNLSGTEVSGDCVLVERFSSNGPVAAVRSRIDGEFRVHNAVLDAGTSGGVALDLSGIEARGPVFLRRETTLRGRLLLRRANIGGRLVLPTEIAAKREGGDTPLVSEEGLPLIDLLLGRASRVEGWLPELDIDTAGFRYDYIDEDPERLWQRRVAALTAAKQFDPGSFDRLALVYRSQGYAHVATRVMEAKERATTRRGGYPRLVRIVRYLEERLTGYGYRPSSAAVVSILIVIFGVVALLTTEKTDWLRHVAPSDWSSRIGWTLDTFIPVVDLGESERYKPLRGIARVLQWTLVVSGWALGTILVAAFTNRAFRRTG